MYKLTLFCVFLFSLISCQGKRAEFHCKKKENSLPSIIGNSFYRVVKIKNNYVVLEPCDANIPKYVVYKDSVFHDWGQEHYSLNVTSWENIDNRIILQTTYKYNAERPDDSDSTIIFQSLDNEKKYGKLITKYL